MDFLGPMSTLCRFFWKLDSYELTSVKGNIRPFRLNSPGVNHLGALTASLAHTFCMRTAVNCDHFCPSCSVRRNEANVKIKVVFYYMDNSCNFADDHISYKQHKL